MVLSVRCLSDHPLSVIGTFSTEIDGGQTKALATFFVTRETGKTLIISNTSKEMGILRVGYNAINKINSEIEKIDTIKGFIVDIPIKPDASPVVQPYRRVPVALEEAADAKIEELLEQGVIEKVNGPSKWISPMVVVPKQDGDMRRANEAVERENHPLPTIEDFLPHIGKGKFFSKLDIKNAFH